MWSRVLWQVMSGTPALVVMGSNQDLIGLLTGADISEAYGLLAARPQAPAAARA